MAAALCGACKSTAAYMLEAHAKFALEFATVRGEST